MIIKDFLKRLRLIPAVNRPIARILKITGLKTWQRYWPLSGSYSLKFKDISFKNRLFCDDHIANALFYGNAWEHEELTLFLEYAKTSRVILDIGANTGIYSILSSKVNPGAEIHSFEPNAYNFKRLEANIALNAPNRIRLTQAAVGDSLEPIEFAVPTKDMISYTSSADIAFSEHTHVGEIEWKKVQVQQVTVDHYCRQQGIPKVDLIKIDVEGFERTVFSGAIDTLIKDRPVIICEIYFTPEIKDFFRELMTKCPYKLLAIAGNQHLRPVSLAHALPRDIGNNFLFLPEKESQ